MQEITESGEPRLKGRERAKRHTWAKASGQGCCCRRAFQRRPQSLPVWDREEGPGLRPKQACPGAQDL